MTELSYNIWNDILDDPAERESCKIKSELMIAVEQYINGQEITQQQAAELMGVTQPKISNIVNGNIDKITIDMLVNMLAKVDVKISLDVGKQPEETLENSGVDFAKTITRYIIRHAQASGNPAEGFPLDAFSDEFSKPQMYTTETAPMSH